MTRRARAITDAESDRSNALLGGAFIRSRLLELDLYAPTKRMQLHYRLAKAIVCYLKRHAVLIYVLNKAVRQYTKFPDNVGLQQLLRFRHWR